jgi:tRNA-dihydrouridine synthase A
MAEEYGYDEVNLNVGCPSDRVQNGRFGACLMAEPEMFLLSKAQMTLNITI